MNGNVSASQTKRLIEWFTYYSNSEGIVDSTAELYIEYLISIKNVLIRSLCQPDIPQEDEIKCALENVLAMEDELKNLLPEDVQL